MKHLLLDFPEFDNQLNDELYHSARLRSLVLSCIFFTVAFGFWINIRLGNLPNRFYISIGIWNQYQWQLILQSVCGTIELLFFFILKKKIIQDNNKLQWFMHVLGFTEISVISVAIWIHVLVEEPLVGLNAPPLMLYGIFILSLALFLEARHCISAGFIAAIQYAWIINSVHKMSGKTHIDGSFYSKAIFLALTGIAASIVASQIRNQLVNTFQAQLNAQEQMLAQKQSALEEQKRITEAYSRFVPSEFLLLLSKTDIRQVELGDCIHKEMSILFSDIRNFTQLSERMTPKQNFDFINLYLKQVGPLIQFHSGYIDKYIGDAVMALFNRSADDAVHAAISMLNQLKNSLNETDIKIGIGINTGPVMLGTVGEANRMEGTVISDAVNLASRLENLNKEYGTEILISEFTLNNMKNPEQFCIRRIDKVRVKGKNQDVEIFEILGYL